MLRRATGWAKGVVAALRRLEFRVLLVGFVVVGGIWAFLALADELSEEDLGGFDRAVAGLFADPATDDPRGPAWLRLVARDVTSLGSVSVLVAVVAFVAGGLAIARRHRQALFVAAAPVTGLLVVWALKHAFGRPRPEGAAALEHATWSFPSGHAFNSAVVYLTLGSLLARFTQRRSLRVYVFAAGLLLTAAVGVTRVYLRYHHASDVLAGWSAGLAWALLCVLAAEFLGRRFPHRGPDVLSPPT